MKGFNFVNCTKQHKYVKNTDKWSSPTAAFESIMATIIVEAMEGRLFTTVDIPGTYLYDKITNEKILILKLKGKFGDIICEVNPDYLKHAH